MRFNESSYHSPVLLRESADFLVGRQDGTYLDCTSGGGGHDEYLLKKFPSIKVIGIDCDNEAIAASKKRLETFGDRFITVRGNFSDSKDLLAGLGYEKVDGVLADLGVSSHQFDEKSRGFSFESDTLDMRMDDTQLQTAADIVNTKSLDELIQIFKRYGEDRYAKVIAQAIVAERTIAPFKTGKQLAECIARRVHRTGKIHPATRVFQALRIEVNGELDNLTKLLKQLPELLDQNGRAVIISYHSLEDRLVKEYFKLGARQEYYKLVNKSIIVPEEQEIRENRRSRSAKMRVVEKC